MFRIITAFVSQIILIVVFNYLTQISEKKEKSEGISANGNNSFLTSPRLSTFAS
jgi:hypothetical protein